MSRDTISLEQNIEARCENSLFLFTSAEFHFEGPQNTLGNDYSFHSNERTGSKRGGGDVVIEAKIEPPKQCFLFKSIFLPI